MVENGTKLKCIILPGNGGGSSGIRDSNWYGWAEDEIKKYGLKAPMVGHVGDGNFHTTIIYDPLQEGNYQMIRDYSNRLIDKALSLEGTVTGEHGIGLQKKEYLIKEHEDNLPYMKLIKKSFDPNNIMNPGKIFDV